MRRLWLHFSFVLFLIAVSVMSILPPEDKLRRGKDLAGGVSLVYQVELKPDDPDNTITRMIDLLKKRVDPKGVLDITMVRQGSSRIEVTMPLPGDKVKSFKVDFEKALAGISAGALTVEQFERFVKLPTADGVRAAEIAKIASGDAERQKLLAEAADAFDGIAARADDFKRRLPELRAGAEAALAALNNAKQAGVAGDALKPQEDAQRAAQDALDAAARSVAEAEKVYASARDKALGTAIPAADVRRALQLSDKDRNIKSEATGQQVKLDSPRKQAIVRLEKDHPAAAAQLKTVLASWDVYEKNRSTLDDPQDLKRLLRGAGVLEFRIASSGVNPDETRLRAELRAGGPKSVKSSEFAWFKINKLESWFDTAEELTAITADPAGYFKARRGLVADVYDGEIYLLLYTTPTASLVAGVGDWKVSGARPTSDELGRPAIAFNMDESGAQRMRQLTGDNKQRPMAVLLDDEVYTAPTIQSEIGKSGQITGNFGIEEVNYVVRVLEAGSLAAKLAPEPVSENVIAPDLGQDNLQRGLYAGVIAFAAVAAFMICYYFTGGGIAVIALVVNLLMILAAMSLNSAKFSLPGIAGVILTFGMAVDANVLIFERMREERLRGNDLKTSVRLAYSKALSAIVDGNLTNLIVCVVLGFTGTPEIKGFAITMAIGTVTTLICQLYITRLIFVLLIDKLHIKKLSMLTLTFPALNRILHPNINWMRYRIPFVIFSITLTGLCILAIFSRGKELLDNEFRGGTKVTIQLAKDKASGKPILRTRAEMQEKLKSTVEKLAATADLASLKQMEPTVVMLNPEGDVSNRFVIKTTMTDTKAVNAAVSEAFRQDMDQTVAIKFDRAGEAKGAELTVLPITVKGTLLENFENSTFAALPGMTLDVSDYVGGGAVMLTDLSVGSDKPTLANLEGRISALSTDPAFAASVVRRHRVVVMEGDEGHVTAAAVLFIDPQIKFDSNTQAWNSDVRIAEWNFVNAAFGRENTLAGLESFSPSIAASFTAQAIVATLLSTVLIIIYVWVRFASLRFSVAAITATLHDCVVAVGFVAMSGYLVRTYPGLADGLGIRDFKVDLNLVAAVLAILGYSLNDTIVILDRVRETKGKSPYATEEIINRSINETLSRTFITSGTTVIATVVLYIFGGEGVREFAFVFLVGVVTGTYSSVAIACPIVWTRKANSMASGGSGRAAESIGTIPGTKGALPA